MTILGIDLGTTNTLVAVLQDGAPATLPNEHGEHLLPSAVAIAADGAVLVGRAAWDRLVQVPDAGRAFFKRDMGTSVTYSFGGRRWTPVECSALVLAEAKRVAGLHLPRPLDRAVITVPAYFRESQRQATAEAARLAGLAVARILNEPTAAALAHGFRAPERETKLLVFDLGGGTFDVTVLEVFAGVVEVRASGGESRLGGEDYTDALLDLVLRRCGLRRNKVAVGSLRARLESLKRRLSVQPAVGLVVEGRELTITRDDLAEAGAPLTARLRPVVAQCLRDARLRREDLHEVLMVGGASRMPMVRSFVAEEIGAPLASDVDPDRVVALGAAIQAGLVAGDAAVTDLVLTDVCAHTLGISTSKQFATNQVVDGYFEPLIERNTTVPVSRAKTFHTLMPQQDTIHLEVYQGESRLTKDNHLLGKLSVTGLRRPAPEHGTIEVRFTYDMSGLLEVDVTVLHSGARFHTLLEERPGTLTARQVDEIRARLQPLRVSPRDLAPNRARLERAARAFARLIGEERKRLTELLDAFEHALFAEVPEEIAATATALDEFLAKVPFEEGDWQPPEHGADGPAWNSPWRILGVSPNSTVDEVRRAYAKLLRQHRPDVDPAGFRRLRDAYEFALRIAEARAAGVNWNVEAWDEEEVAEHADEPANAAAPTMTWFTPREAPRAEAVSARPRSLASPLRTALLRARATNRRGTEARLFAILARALRARPHERDLADLVLDELAAPEGQLRQHLQPAAVQGVTNLGGASLVQALLVAHIAAEDWNALWAAVRAIETMPSVPGDVAGLTAAMDAAQVVALFQAEAAERLADAAFRRAGPDARHSLGEADHWIQAGKQIRVRASRSEKRQLVLALCDPRVRADDPVAQRAIALGLETEAPLLGALLAGRFPSAAAQFQDQLATAKERTARRRRAGSRRRSEPKRERFGWRQIVFVILMALSVGARTCGSTASPPPRWQQDRTIEMRKRARDAMQLQQPATRPENDAGKNPGERR